MASSGLLGFLAILLIILPMAASIKGGFFDGFLDNVCDQVECGKGKCTANSSYPLKFVCECDSGWKRTRDDDNFTFANSFLPCVIPECSLDYGCQPAPPPVPEKDYPYNISAYDPCYWAYCGAGSCVKNRTHTHQCQCNSGTLGSDCSRLGIKVADATADSQDGQASSILPGRLHWIVMLLISTGMVMWN